MRLAVCQFAAAFADLPVHCLRGDIAGHWDLHFTPPTARGESSSLVPSFPSDTGAEFCLHKPPNNNGDNVALMAREDALGLTSVQVVELTLDQHPALVDGVKGHTLVVRGAEGEGSWTTSYDEGWEARVPTKDGHLMLFAMAKYTCAEDNGKCGATGDSEDEAGATKGYASLCGQTQVGWYSKKDVSGALVGMGCWWGAKQTESEQVASFVAFQEGTSTKQVRRSRRPSSLRRSVAISASGKLTRDDAPSFLEVAPRSECNADQLRAAESVALPQAFDWRREFGGAWDSPVADQGECGSCYSMAETYAFQSRVNIGLCKAGHCDKGVRLSPESVLQCSYYNQGCDGGYAFLVARHAHDFGIPPESCHGYQEGKSGACKKECFADESQLWYASDYGYVGGFYGKCSETRLMQSIQEHGPIAVSFEVPQSIFGTNGEEVEDGRELNHHLQRDQTPSVMEVHIDGPDQLLQSIHTDLTSPSSGLRRCMQGRLYAETPSRGPGVLLATPEQVDDGFLEALQACLATGGSSLAQGAGAAAVKLLGVNDESVNGWEYTNHVVVAVGWGVSHNGKKYWLLRNSWGAGFGNGGYFKVDRSHDAMGFESQGVFSQVDWTRGAGAAFAKGMTAAPPAL
mmetsp:Transcript_97078/g.222487  ORF Transcript_97078/g.222487 Transcript_97078/m.222487 type:complete len:628 (+) Transcript_97078:37-1920(+)|eukprot:CAMPEP_0204308270 /NCGR_PEP_ID=MMETSP0469-20131031/407_1 /ASSEMBLY_ACC=CAM_ASM_000384 /TAXON_ID=2969 /ORGANISM="Oxyrrhis marina" /LENGTH=627 /DNA_ID=CAMNT_0051287725 /DNA_START=37 /DNA_END=1920 /DNA_ORIENTATION=-